MSEINKSSEGISLNLQRAQAEVEKFKKCSDQSYLEIFNAATDPILIFNGDTLEIIEANRAFLNIFGYSREELPNLTIMDISHGEPPFNLEGTLEVLQTIENFGPQVLEWLSRKRDGNTFWTEVRVDSVLLGGRRRILASLRDLTQQLQIRQALEEREQTLSSVLEAAPLLICLITQENVVWSNKQVQSILGYTNEEIDGAAIASFFPSSNEFSQIKERIFGQLLSQGMAKLEVELRHKDGHSVPVDMRLAPLDGNDPTREAICIIADISQRKEWEITLMEREARYSDLFDNAPVGILRTTANGRVVHLNKALSKMLGFDSPDHLVTELKHDIVRVYVERSRYEQLMLKLQEHGSVRDFEAEWVDRQGGTRVMLINMRSVDDNNEQLIDGFVTDLTEKRRIEQEARERDKQLIQADKLISLGILTSGVAHEINNPNNFIALNAPLLKKAFVALQPILDSLADQDGDFMVGGLPYSRMREHLPRLVEGILSGSRRISEIVENMRRLASPNQQGPTESVDLNIMLHSVLPYIKTRLSKQRCRLELELAESLPQVKANPQQIQQVILNLLLNALDAMEDSCGKRLIVSTNYNTTNSRVLLSVIDEGSGIPPGSQEQLFTPFFTTKRGCGGTGLGLAISHKIMQVHGGNIELHNNTHTTGATAIMSIPLVVDLNEIMP